MENGIYPDLKTETVIEQTKSDEHSSGFSRFLLDLLETIILSVLLFVGINAISARIRVEGYSMEPTLSNGEFVIVNKLAYQVGTPQFGDVIVFRFPRDPSQEYIKRIIGLSGDQVVITNGQLFINDLAHSEPYISESPDYQSEWVVPDESLFVLGDNRNKSSDSHNWGMVPIEYVIGKAQFVYWPPTSWGLVDQLHAASAAQEGE